MSLRWLKVKSGWWTSSVRLTIIGNRCWSAIKGSKLSLKWKVDENQGYGGKWMNVNFEMKIIKKSILRSKMNGNLVWDGKCGVWDDK